MCRKPKIHSWYLQINAWSELLKYYEDELRDILKIINCLKQIRELAEKEFPNARSFIRRGFDEVNKITERQHFEEILKLSPLKMTNNSAIATDVLR